MKEVSSQTKLLLHLINKLNTKRGCTTLIQILRGSKAKKIKPYFKFKEYNKGTKWPSNRKKLQSWLQKTANLNQLELEELKQLKLEVTKSLRNKGAESLLEIDRRIEELQNE